MYKVEFSNRVATCKDCKASIDAMEPRVAHEREDDLPEGEDGSGFRKMRFCLKCGIKRVEVSAKETLQVLSAARNVWNAQAQRLGRPKKSKKAVKPRTVECDCGAEAVVLLKRRGSGKLWLCEKGHFWIE